MFRYFENLVNPFQDAPLRDHPPQTVLGLIRDYCAGFRGVFIATGVITVLAASIELVLIYALGWLIDLLSSKSPAQVIDQDLPILLGLVAFVLVIRPLVYFVEFALLNNTLITNIATAFRWRAHRHVIRQSIGWFENDFAGRISNRVMQTPGAAGEVVFIVFDALAYAIAYAVGAAIVLQDAHPQLVIPMIVWLASYFALVRWAVVRIGPASKAASDARSNLNGRIVDSYTNIHSVKMFANDAKELEFARSAIASTRETVAAEMRIFTKMDVVLMLLNGLLILSVVGWSVWLWMQGATTTGVVAASSALVLRLNAMTGWIMWAVTTFFREIGVMREGMETIAHPLTLRDRPNAPNLSLTTGRIEFDQLTHHYGQDAGGLDTLSLTIEPGQKVGLVGRSGAGKSTLLKLLLRFYDAEQGRILIDGQDISQVTQNSLRRSIGMVQQDNSLLHRSIRDNIAYGRTGVGQSEVSDADILDAARRAQALDFITTLTDRDGNIGLDAKVGERGVKLSGGQRQRIALARVILKDAPILLLDEATSALDSEVEAAILDTLYDMMQGKTVIAIAHRLSTIAQMDRIIVMDQGRIIQDGAHDVLLAQGGLYADLWTRQSGGFLTND